MLSRDTILGFEDTDIGTVFVKEFGGDVGVATLSALEADQIKNLGTGGVPTNVGLVILGACDDKGVRLFTAEDAPMLGKKPSKALTAIANKILEHNGLNGDDEAKNGSSETEGDASASVSLSPSDEPSPS